MKYEKETGNILGVRKLKEPGKTCGDKGDKEDKGDTGEKNYSPLRTNGTGSISTHSPLYQAPAARAKPYSLQPSAFSIQHSAFIL